MFVCLLLFFGQNEKNFCNFLFASLVDQASKRGSTFTDFDANSFPNWEGRQKISLASRLNGYIYSNGKSLNVALFILMANHLF